MTQLEICCVDVPSLERLMFVEDSSESQGQGSTTRVGLRRQLDGARAGADVNEGFLHSREQAMVTQSQGQPCKMVTTVEDRRLQSVGFFRLRE